MLTLADLIASTRPAVLGHDNECTIDVRRQNRSRRYGIDDLVVPVGMSSRARAVLPSVPTAVGRSGPAAFCLISKRRRLCMVGRQAIFRRFQAEG